MLLTQFNPIRFFADKKARLWDKLSDISDTPIDTKSILVYEAGTIPPFSVIVESGPQAAAPTVSAKLYNYHDEQIQATLNTSVESGIGGYYSQVTVAGTKLSNQNDKYVYIKLTIDSTDYYSDVFEWAIDTTQLLKLTASAAKIRVGGYVYSMLNTPIEVYLNVEPLTFKPKVDQTGIEQQAITNVYYAARAIPREFEIHANDSIYIFLSALGILKVNGSVSISYGYETWKASDILLEETTAHINGTYQLKLTFVDESETVGVVNG